MFKCLGVRMMRDSIIICCSLRAAGIEGGSVRVRGSGSIDMIKSRCPGRRALREIEIARSSIFVVGRLAAWRCTSWRLRSPQHAPRAATELSHAQ